MSKEKTNEILRLIAQTQFRPFTDLDWQAFSGTEGKNPLIAYVENGVLIIDDEGLAVLCPDEGTELTFKLTSV